MAELSPETPGRPRPEDQACPVPEQPVKEGASAAEPLQLPVREETPTSATSLSDLRPPRRVSHEAVSSAGSETEGSERGVTSASSLLAVRSWTELERLYAEKGFVFDSDKDLYAFAQGDWRRHAEVMLWRARQCTETGSPLVAKVELRDKSVSLVGIVHSLHLLLQGSGFTVSVSPDGEKYLGAILNERRKFPCWIAEHNLSTYFTGPGVPEILDHAAEGTLRRLRSDLKRWWIDAPRKAIWRADRAIRRYRSERQGGRPVATEKDLIRDLTHVPPDALSPAPIYLQLLWKERNGLPFSNEERRSAFQAEFLRHVDPQRALSSGAATEPYGAAGPSDLIQVGFICGKAHVPQILFFLEHRIPDKSLIARARHDAELFNQSIPGYYAVCQRREAIYLGLSFAVSAAIGTGLGSCLGFLF